MTIQKNCLNRLGRPKLYSPGQPTAGRPVRQQFWLGIYSGLSTVEAALSAKVSCAVGVRWFREAGGMPPSHLKQSAPPLSGRYLSFVERERISIERAKGHGIRQIARTLSRSASTISRELRRNAATRSGRLEYRATTAQWHADRAASRPKCVKLVTNPTLREYVQERLSGKISSANGRVVKGPQVAWKGRRHGPRQHRRWARAWSPAQIACRLRQEFPNDTSMRISHEAIYQALYVQGRGALRRELTACLRTGRTLRVPRARTGRGKSRVPSPIAALLTRLWKSRACLLDRV